MQPGCAVLPIENKKALADDSEFVKTLCAAAKNLEIGIVAAAFVQGKIKSQNSAFIIDKTEDILMKYSEVHTCNFAGEKCLERGNKF